jgi:hypothetical protein
MAMILPVEGRRRWGLSGEGNELAGGLDFIYDGKPTFANQRLGGSDKLDL